MILINATSQYAKAERLVDAITDEVESWIETLEQSGFAVSFTNLPSHIDTHEVYAAILLDQFAEIYLPQGKNVDKGSNFH